MAYRLYEKPLAGVITSRPAIRIEKNKHNGWWAPNKALRDKYGIVPGSTYSVFIDKETGMAAMLFNKKGVHSAHGKALPTLPALRQAVTEELGRPEPGTYPVTFSVQQTPMGGVEVCEVAFKFLERVP